MNQPTRTTLHRPAGQSITRGNRVAGVVGLFAAWLFIAGSAFGQAAATAAPWIGQEEEIEQILRHGEIVASKDVGEGITKPVKVTLAYGGRQLDAIWKPLDRLADPSGLERYEAEVAAYRLSRHLGLDMVPPTVSRRIGDREGSVQMWVYGFRQAADVEDTPVADQLAQWSQAVARMKFFDELIDNPDRHAANYLVDDDWTVVLIDHSRAMFFDNAGRMRAMDPPKRFDRSLVEKTRELDLAELDALLGDLFTKSELKTVLHRRNELLQHVERVVETRGEQLAFYEP
jgi:hypothetical protein